jgi:hypothetical protein
VVREERPAFERNTIDMSEWTCVNYRYVMGQHFDFLDIYEPHAKLATLCKIIWTLV